MRFKVGDIATIRPDLNCNTLYDKYYANLPMCEHAGCTTKILYINETLGIYRVCADKEQYKWTEEMFEGWLR